MTDPDSPPRTERRFWSWRASSGLLVALAAVAFLNVVAILLGRSRGERVEVHGAWLIAAAVVAALLDSRLRVRWAALACVVAWLALLVALGLRT